MNNFSILLMTLPLVGVIGIGKVQAQITPADRATKVEEISENGGTRSKISPITDKKQISGTNQFHSLTQFNLNKNDVAEFQAKDGITNILTRVTGGDVSKINGEIKVTGGNNPNLFLMNPAGFIFGKDAKTLNLPGSLTVTTANGIGFGSGSNTNFFNATGSNDYSKLTDNPTAFAFTMGNPGAIVNSGDLSVKKGQNLTLVGGTVVNTGTLDANNGQITIAAVPGKSTVRISQQGNLLSLDIASTTETTGNPNSLPSGFKIESLPDLLAGGNISSVTGITVNEDNTVTLTGSDISVKDGDVVNYNSNSVGSFLVPVNDFSRIAPLNVSIISKNGNIKIDRITSREKVFLSAEKGNIEVDTIFAGIPEGFEDRESGNFVEARAGDINIKAGGFFRAIGKEEQTENVEGENAGNKILASITVANTVSSNKAFISIKTKNDPKPKLINKPGDRTAEVKIEVGSEFFVVGNGEPKIGNGEPKKTISFKNNESGTIEAIAERASIDTSTPRVVSDITFGKADPPPIIKPPPSEKPGDSNTDGTNTDGKNARNLDNGNQEQQQDRDQNRDRDRNQNQEQEEITVFDVLSLDESQNQEQEEITVFGVLSLDESLVALLKDKGHASELTLSNDGNGELTGSDFNLFNTDNEEELKTFNFDRDLLYKNYVFSRK